MIKYPVRTLLRIIRDIDGFLHWLTKLPFKNHYKITGTCHKCGQCCEKIAIYFSDEFWRYNFLKKIGTKWYEFVYNFKKKHEEPDLKVIVFKCNYIKDLQCSIYRRRPYICRDYPKPRFFEKPVFLSGCSFSSNTCDLT